ncbi:MAG: AraC family transcriptional regulator [Armatimonadota bacterium]|nr:AraC family transcriptional regulator [Armatimonadota bacterium]
MDSVHPVSDVGRNAFARATRYDYRLTAAAPINAESNTYAEETPLEIDVHAGTEVGIVLAGSQERHFEDLVCPLVPGDVWLCATWEPHGWRTTAPRSRDVVLIFLPEFLGEEELGNLSWLSLFSVAAKDRPRVTTPAMRERVLDLGGELLDELTHASPGWESAIRLDLLRLLLTLSRGWEPPRRSELKPSIRASNLPRLAPAIDLVHSRPLRRISLGEAAKACGLSRAQFCLLFRSTMGLSFGMFCRRSRLGRVAQLLLSTDLSTETIAGEAGFADGSHLHRAFVKQYGCTPGVYRAQALQQ